MSPYAVAASESLKATVTAVLALLAERPRQMSELLEALSKYGSAEVKSAVWQLIDEGRVRLLPDRSLRAA
jgi:cytochrome P450